MDLEVWMKNLGVEPVSGSEKTEAVQVAYGAEKATETAEDERINVVFFLDARGSVPAEEFGTMKQLIRDTAQEVLSGYMHRVNLSVMISYGGTTVSEIPLNDLASFSRIDAITNSVAPKDDKSEMINVTSCFDTMYEIYKDREKDTLFIMFVNDNMILANTADSPKVYQKLAKSEKIHVSLVSDTRSENAQNYVTSIIRRTNGKIIKSDMASVKDYITGYLPNTYSIITANNYEPVVLKDILKKNSGTDTDKDGLVDWEEVDVEAIREIKPETNEKTYLLMKDMPTIDQCAKYYHEKYFYVPSGLVNMAEERGKSENDGSETPLEVVLREAGSLQITPIISNPGSEDSDEDGLLDNEYQYGANGNIIAPKEKKENRLKTDGPIGMWKKHIETMQSFEAPEELGDWYGQTSFDSENTGVEGFAAFGKEFGYWLERVENNFLKSSIEQDLGWAFFYHEIGLESFSDYMIAQATDKLINCFPLENRIEIEASLGSRFLNFRMDDQNMAIHSQHLSWQSTGGYNNFYDGVFRTFTNDNMDSLKLPFVIDTPFKEFVNRELASDDFTKEIVKGLSDETTTDLIVWAWHGDYLNLGAGAEIGIYFRPTNGISNPNGLDHYFAHPDFTLPMQLYLYNYESAGSIENIFVWEPDEDQWWITGFDPKWADRVDVRTQVVIGCVDFSRFTDSNGKNGVYEALQSDVADSENKKKFVLFDDDNKTVWLCWYWDKELQREKN